MDAATPKQRKRQTDVIAAATEVFYRKGYSAASIQEVADAVGVLKGSLYYYIDSKEDLLFRICEAVHHESLAILHDVLAIPTHPVERLRIYIERHVTWYLENTAMVGVFFRDWRFLSGERLDVVAAHRHGYDHTVRELIAAAQGVGQVDQNLDAKFASLYILAAVNAVPEWHSPSGPDPASRIAAAYAALAVGTLVGDPSRRGASR